MYNEREFVRDAFRGAFLSSPTEEVWRYSDRKVFFDQKQTAQMDRYDSAETPWNRVFQDVIREVETQIAAYMKSSQSGGSQGAINAVTYKPENMPGNVLYAINSREKGADVANVRIGPQIKRVAGAHVSEDPDDFSTLTIRLKNMVIKISGSGSTSPVRETWYDLIIIDEAEDFPKLKGESSFDKLAFSRFATVPNPTLMIIGKPQQEAEKSEPDSAMVHYNFLRGTQEEWLMPCPCCGERIMFETRHFDHSRFQRADGTWDLKKMGNEIDYICQKCGGTIKEYQKAAMVAEGEWTPAPENERMKLAGEPVDAEPGVRSFHINDYVSPWPQVTWGKLAVKYVLAHFVNADEAAQDEYRKNHEGLPAKSKEIVLGADVINALRGGIENKYDIEIPQPDGTTLIETRTEIIGQRFSLCYDENGKRVADLPCNPCLISISVDKQDQYYKWTVVAWAHDGQSWLIDIGTSGTDGDLMALRNRPYYVEDSEKPRYIWGGPVDRGNLPREVYKLCFAAQALGFQLFPALGYGTQNDKYTSDWLAKRTDTLKNGRKIDYFRFHDHSVKIEFYHRIIQQRRSPRFWLPDPVPHDIVSELTAERWDKSKQKFIHDRHKDGPNDYGDSLKMQHCVLWPLFGPVFSTQEE